MKKKRSMAASVALSAQNAEAEAHATKNATGHETAPSSRLLGSSRQRLQASSAAAPNTIT